MVASEAAPRALAAVGLALAVGAGVWRLRLLPPTARAPGVATNAVARAETAVARIGVVGTVAALVAAAWALAAKVGELADGNADATVLRAVLWHTRWGHRWSVQLVLLVLAAVAYWLAGRDAFTAHGASVAAPDTQGAARRSRTAWAIGVAAALGAAGLHGVMGHAGADTNAPFASLVFGAAHVLAATVWLGSVAILAAVWRMRREAPNDFAAPQLAAFAPIALTAAAVTALAGAGNAWLRLAGAGGPAARLAALPSTPYGRVLLAKLCVVLVVVAAGAVNARRSAAHRAASRATAGQAGRVGDATAVLDLPALDRGARVELAAALVVCVLSAALAASMPPGAE